jgi:uncharacterized membrane-anchored protein YitT (DUF2179 family)
MAEKFTALLIGSFLIGVGINIFLVPHKLLDGGVIGLGLLIHYYAGFPAGLCMILISIPIYIIAWLRNRKVFYNSLHGLIISSLCIDLLSGIHFKHDFSLLTSSLIGGFLIGTGIGLMLRYDISTGGTDLLAQLISKKTAINVGILIFLIDGAVISGGIGIVGFGVFLYSFLTIAAVGAMTFITVVNKA